MGDWDRQAFWTSWRKINPSMEPSFRHCLPRAMLGAVRKVQKWHGPLSQHWLGEQLSGALLVPRALLMLGSLRWTGPDQQCWKTNKTRVSKSTLMLNPVELLAEFGKGENRPWKNGQGVGKRRALWFALPKEGAGKSYGRYIRWGVGRCQRARPYFHFPGNSVRKPWEMRWVYGVLSVAQRLTKW